MDDATERLDGRWKIARCPEHGLHGERETCFECAGPVEQVPVVPVDAAAVERAARSICAWEGESWECCGERAWYREMAEVVLRAAGEDDALGQGLAQ